MHCWLTALLLFVGISNHLGNDLVLCVDDFPDFDSLLGGCGNPLHLGIEGNLIDSTSCINDLEWLLEVHNVPDVEFFVFTTCGNSLSVGCNGHVVDVTFVGFERVLNLEVEAPDFQSSVPSS